jgi:multidrug efflux pump subunit AcrA (membrane-fusion protein)
MSEEYQAILDDIDESNEQIRVVLGQVPNWFLRWGTTVIFFCLLMIVMLCWYIKYPDVVTAEITITTQNSPITVVSRTDGKLNPIFVADHDQVRKGQVLAVIENTAHYEDVYALLRTIENLASPESPALAAFAPNAFWRLGEVQESYQASKKATRIGSSIKV